MRRGLFKRIQMKRIGNLLWILPALLCLSATPTPAALPAGETLVPAASRFFVTFRSIGDLRKEAQNSLLGQLFDEPLMKAFIDDLQQQIERRVATAEVQLGISFDDLKDLTTGQLTVAIMPLAPNPAGEAQAGVVVLVEATNLQKLQNLRQKISNELARAKAQPSQFNTPTGAAGTHYAIPPQKEGARGGEIVEAVQAVGGDQVWLFGNNGAVVEVVSAKIAGAPAIPALADDAVYKKLMADSAPAAGEPAAQIALFVDPLGLSETVRAWEWPRKKHKPDDIVVFRNAGFDQLKGFGGQATFSHPQYGLLVRAAGLAPQPWQKSLNMLTFLPGNDFSPQPWIAADAAGYATVYWDILKAFDHFGPLFDGFLEDEGIWADVLEGYITDPDGPKIDIRAEFFDLLGRRVTAVVDVRKPISPDGAQEVIVLELKDAKLADRVKAALKKMFAGDENVEKMKLGELDVYKIIATEDVPPNAPNQEGVVNGKRQLVSSLVTVANGNLWIASDAKLLQKMLGPAPAQPLATSPDYVALTAALASFLPPNANDLVGLGFVRSDELVNVDYELFRTGRMEASQTILGRVLNVALLDRERSGKRKLQLDGSKLPPFEQVRKYFAPLGILLRQTPDGWSAIGLTNDKGPPRAAADTAPKSAEK